MDLGKSLKCRACGQQVSDGGQSVILVDLAGTTNRTVHVSELELK